MAYIFSYGTLQDAAVQRATFGRILEGAPDSLARYHAVSLTFTDPALIASCGKALHTNLKYTGTVESQVAGTRLTVTEQELTICDKYEQLAKYRRKLIALESGKQAWVYTFAP